MKSLTFFFVLGGHISHYDNLARCLYTIKERINYQNFKVVILEFGSKLKSNERCKVIHAPKEINFDTGKKIGYKIWQQKYRAALETDTDYAMYVDTDTVLHSSSFDSLIDFVGEGIGVVPHFWVPTIGYFRSRAVPPKNYSVFDELISNMGLIESDPFFAGGAFIFKNNENNRNRMKWIWDKHVEFYSEREYVPGITDELFLAGAVKKFGNSIILPGSINHCSMGDEHMPMVLKDGILHGSNSFEKYLLPITFLHCDVSKHSNCSRDPSKEYSGEMKEAVKKSFLLNKTFVNSLEDYENITDILLQPLV